MKICVFALVIIAAIAFTADDIVLNGNNHTEGTGPVSIDGTAYSQAWDVGNATHGVSIYGAGDRWACDDFVLTGDWELNQVVIWMIWTGEMGTSMNIVFAEDDGSLDPNSATVVWSESVPSDNVFADEWESSGGTLYDIYEFTGTINSDAYPVLSDGVTYWIQVQADVVDNCFIMLSDNTIGSTVWYNDGSGLWVSTIDHPDMGWSTDMFFDMYGENTALESSTWADIKSLF